MKKLFKKYRESNLILRIVIGLIIGTVVGILCNLAVNNESEVLRSAFAVNTLGALAVIFEVFGNLFIGGLRAIAPVLVFFLITASLMGAKKAGSKTVQKTMGLYALGTFSAAFIAVVINVMFPVTLVLPSDVDISQYSAPSGIGDIVVNIFSSIVANPIDAVANANFLGVIFWSILFGICARPVLPDKIKEGFHGISEVLTAIVKIIIDFAPFGICGLVFTAILDNGLGIFMDYGILLCVYLSILVFVAFVFNALIVGLVLRRNPYPLIFRSIKDVAITAFFMRSSAANIPVNMKFCEELHLDKKSYSITIPIGSTINMEGASITIITLTLCCCHTLGIDLDFGTALVLSLIAAISAIGTSGVSGGSILLVPMACSLFGIGGDIAAGVVAVGFIIGVIQDSVETALNSSTDGMFTAAVQLREQIDAGQPYHKIVGGTLDDKSKTK